MTKNIAVSVCVIAYNQEKFIAQCLESIANQTTNFAFEIIVSDDYSTDGTRKIIEDIQEKHPQLITSVFHPKNVGPVKNCITAYQRASGKYICHIDGDDYALPGKLQAQYDALEKNLDCIICSHDVVMVNAENKLVRNSFCKKKSGVYTLDDLYAHLPFFAHSSKMFRNTPNNQRWNDLPDTTLDIELHVLQAQFGNIYHIDEVLGGYHYSTGVSATTGRVNPILVEGTRRIFEQALIQPHLDKDTIKKHYALAQYKFAYNSALRGDHSGLKNYIEESLAICKFSSVQSFFGYLAKLPPLVVFLCRLRAKIKGYSEI